MHLIRFKLQMKAKELATLMVLHVHNFGLSDFFFFLAIHKLKNCFKKMTENIVFVEFRERRGYEKQNTF